MGYIKHLVSFLLVLIVVIVGVFWYSSFSSSSNLFGDVVSRVDTSENVVFLTFDDGPSYRTEELLEVLSSKNVSATFFLLGENVEIYPEETLQMFERGFDIGSHSYSHPYLYRNIYVEEFKSKSIIERTINSSIYLFRPPYGFRTPETLRIAKQMNLTSVMWSSFPKDYLNFNDTSEKIIDNLKPGVIIVLHDHGRDYEAVDYISEVIDLVRDRGYEFGKLSDYLNR